MYIEIGYSYIISSRVIDESKHWELLYHLHTAQLATCVNRVDHFLLKSIKGSMSAKASHIKVNSSNSS